MSKIYLVAQVGWVIVPASLHNIARNNNWIEKTSIIDLTGANTVIPFVLNGRFVGSAWLSGGYPGSSKFVRKILENSPENIVKNSWIVTSDNCARRIKDTGLELGLTKNHILIDTLVKKGHNGGNHYFWVPKQ